MTRTIYLLDDEAPLVALLSEVVELVGMKPRGYTRASRFFEQVTDCEPDAILVLDLHMPEMDGIEVMRRVARMARPPALILTSGYDVGVLHAAEKLGRTHGLEILASLVKPVAIEHFRDLLERAISGDESQRPANGETAARDLNVADLHAAIRDDQLILHYQPQLEMATGALVGVEALVRWQHPEHGLIPPDRFIPLAERCGCIWEVTRWVIGRVVAEDRHWQDAGLPLTVSANISADDVTGLTLPEQLTALLVGNTLDPTRLTLEVTETALMGELVTSLDILTRLRMKGIGLSIDDFGTGYSSLSQLHRAPFTELKVDRSFVAAMADDGEARAIVKTCILLGHELDLRVVAEGVEDQRAWDLLVALGCDVAQGYLIARPMRPSDLLEWENNRARSV